MHPVIAYQLAVERHAELIAGPHRRPVGQALPARFGRAGPRRISRRWSWWVLGPNRALAAKLVNQPERVAG